MSLKKNILILARPDHSFTIYKALQKSNFSFLYCSFKLFPSWSKQFIKNPRARYYSRNYSNCVLLSALHIYRTTFHKRWMERFEKPLFEFHLKFLLPFLKPKLIHYWPNFCQDSIRKYKEKHPELKTFADVYYPCEQWVVDNIIPQLNQLGLGDGMDQVVVRAKMLPELMAFENNFIVPSEFIAKTYRKYYPDKNYIVIPYGIPRWEGYVKKNQRTERGQIKHFVYAGQITYQKGCDLLMQYFDLHKEVELHLYGGVPKEQQQLFDKYKVVENIHFHGTIPKQLMMKEMSQYDVGIHMSRFDAYSLSVAEMMAAGLPVLVSNNTGIYYQVEEINSGLVTKLDEASIADSVNKIRDPEIYNSFVNNLDDYLSSPFPSYEEQMLEFYRRQISLFEKKQCENHHDISE